MTLETAKILVVDDEPANVVLVNRALSKAGFENLIGITDPRAALGAIREAEPDLVLLDLAMPHVDGYQILEQMQAIPPDERAPVLVLTADASDASRQRALAFGAQDFITKPFRIVELVLRVRNQLEVVALTRSLARRARRLEQDVAASRGDTEAERERRRRASLAIDEIIDDDRFTIDLHPIVELHSNGQVGAIVRAIVPDAAPLGADWFADARMLGFGHRLELAALRRALDVARMLPDRQFAWISVSPELSVDPVLVSTLAGAALERVVLDVPQQQASADVSELHALRRSTGLSIALHAAGLVSSNECLLRWRPDIVAFDGSLHQGPSGDDPWRPALVRALVEFASETSVTLHATEVHEQRDAELLWALGVPWASGPLFASPSTSAEPRTPALH